MAALSVLLAAVLLAAAALHGLWGLRVWWPLGDERQLARAVVGARDIEEMPSQLSCFAVMLALVAVALIGLMLGGVVGSAGVPRWLLLLSGFGSAAVFILRGAAGFAPFWARMAPEEPFRTYDRKYYSPLCLLLAAGFAALLWAG